MDIKKAYRDAIKITKEVENEVQHRQFIEKKNAFKNPMKPVKGSKFNSAKFSNKPKNLNRRTGR